jgi:hypothetical protein
MILSRFVAAIALSAGLFATPAVPQDGAVPQNAAVEYWRAGYWTLTETNTREAGGSSPINDLNWGQIGTNLDPARMPEAYQKAKAYLSETAVRDFINASRRPVCDFMIPIQNGPMTLMPHLGILRNLARSVRFDAREQLIAGNADAAAERLGAIYRASGHLCGDSILISSLVAGAMASMAHDELKTLLGSGKLTESGRKEILTAIESLDARDPYNLVGAIRGEQRVMLGWIKETFKGADAGSRFAKEVAPTLSDVLNKDVKLMEAISMMREEQFAESIRQTERYYDDIIAVWQSDSVPSRLATLDARLKQGAYGPVAVLLGPSLQKAHESSEKARLAREESVQKLRAYRPAGAKN